MRNPGRRRRLWSRYRQLSGHGENREMPGSLAPGGGRERLNGRSDARDRRSQVGRDRRQGGRVMAGRWRAKPPHPRGWLPAAAALACMVPAGCGHAAASGTTGTASTAVCANAARVGRWRSTGSTFSISGASRSPHRSPSPMPATHKPWRGRCAPSPRWGTAPFPAPPTGVFVTGCALRSARIGSGRSPPPQPAARWSPAWARSAGCPTCTASGASSAKRLASATPASQHSQAHPEPDRLVPVASPAIQRDGS